MEGPIILFVDGVTNLKSKNFSFENLQSQRDLMFWERVRYVGVASGARCW